MNTPPHKLAPKVVPVITPKTEPAPTMVGSYAFNADGTAVDTRTHQRLGRGFAAYVKSHRITAECVQGEYTYGSEGDTVAAFANGLILFWKPGQHVQDNLGGYVVAGIVNALKAAK